MRSLGPLAIQWFKCGNRGDALTLLKEPMDGVKRAVGDVRCLVSMRLLRYHCGGETASLPPAVIKGDGEKVKRHRLILSLLPHACHLAPIAATFCARFLPPLVPLALRHPLTAMARGGSECVTMEVALDTLVDNGYMSPETQRAAGWCTGRPLRRPTPTRWWLSRASLSVASTSRLAASSGGFFSTTGLGFTT
jgi:hypothetical protein